MTNSKFIDLAVTPGELGREDTQGCWQFTIADHLHKAQILDVGAGLGASKQRMENRGHTVTTQDVGPELKVDLCKPISEIGDDFADIVTCFDVIEHIPDYRAFMNDLRRIARRKVFITTPNIAYTGGTHKYHFHEFSPSEFLALAESVGFEFDVAWMMFPDGPPNIRRATRMDYINDAYCYNFGILLNTAK